MSAALTGLSEKFAQLDALRAAIAMMEWDQQTFMPEGGARARAEHLSQLGRFHHELMTSDETRETLEQAKVGAEGDDADMLRVFSRDLDLATKLPVELVAEKSRLAAQAHEEWVKARAENDFKSFAPTLERMFEIARQEAEYLGYKDHIYDALLDQYEEGATAAEARAMFDSIKGPQVQLVKQIAEKPVVDDSILYGDWDKQTQREFTELLVRTIGFDLTRGRQDTAPHPFCTGWSRGDVRLTTRFKSYLPSAIFGSLHEAGHGMYEQGTPENWDLTPLAGGVSLGVHESQSRTWENIVGRSLAFWERFLPDLQARFPALGSLTPREFYRLINKVKPSLIRVEADELTYNLHVLIRFELECDLLTGALKVIDLPEAWNEKYREYLGIVPKSDSEGCLQDVHWSQGSIGYFPTYTMGNLLSYQIWGVLEADLGDVDSLMRDGDFSPIKDWLIEKVYRKARSVPPRKLIEQVTGSPMNPSRYLQGLSKKYTDLYQL
jgi:carboxypeptidase Taq